MRGEVIYLDYNATTPCLPEVVSALESFSLRNFGNPSSSHLLGREAKRYLEDFRKVVAELLEAEPEEIVFTSGGTEANHLALLGIALEKEKGHLLVSAFEHPSVLYPVLKLSERGFKVDFIPVSSEGYVEVEEVVKRIKRDTLLISVMLANNEIGTLQPIKEIAKICKERGILLHTDACQAVGKVPVSVKELQCDLLSLAGHKMYAPKGIGALFIRKGIKISPLFLGGGQERGLRAGTEPLALIAGLAKAAEIAQRDLKAEGERLLFLREKLWEGLQEIYPKVIRFGKPERTLPNTLMVSFVGLKGAELLSRMPQICASTGAACHDHKGSLTLSALGASPEISEGAVRFSLGRYTNLEEIEKALEILKDTLNRYYV
ncbi:MAG: cysteine desulfurase family protein [Thermodesulfobacterium sp.]|nr:cysteine desulfurase family protein [Thermodesulfobacterium sp.]